MILCSDLIVVARLLSSQIQCFIFSIYVISSNFVVVVVVVVVVPSSLMVLVYSGSFGFLAMGVIKFVNSTVNDSISSLYLDEDYTLSIIILSVNCDLFVRSKCT